MINITIDCKVCNYKFNLSSDKNNIIEVSKFKDFLFYSPELTTDNYPGEKETDHILKLECQNCGNSIVLQDFYNLK